MINFFYNYGLFFAEVFTVVIALIVIFFAIVAIFGKSKFKAKERIEITNISEKFSDIKKELQSEIFSKDELKEIERKEKIKNKQIEKDKKKHSEAIKKRIFVLNFDGDIRASEVENFREEITAVLTIATPKDEVLVCIESAGGMIPHYGLAASQLKRIRDRGIPLIVAVDKIAASGGYMMACVANKIFAAPFAVVGSIGVIAQLPNFNRFLKKHDVDFEQIMAGEYKRTLTVLGENTNKGRKKFQEEIEEAHELFKAFIAMNRPSVDINSIATGEHWYGARAKDLKLVDEIITSDDYLLRSSEKADIFEISYVIKKSLAEKFNITVGKVYSKLFYSRADF